MIQFQHIEYLLALAAVPVMVACYFFVVRWKKKTALRIGDPVLVKQLIRDYSPARFGVKFLLFTTAFSIAVIALANPRIPKGSATVKRSGIDVMIALDISKSMLAQDIKPDRLERAKQVLAKLIDRLDDDRIGIVVFAGRAYLQMPLTTDHTAAKMYLSSISTDAVPTQGTVIGDALKMSYAAFNSKEKKYKSIILVSDGEDHDENAVNYAKSLADEGVMINTIGIGSPEGAMIMEAETGEYKKDKTGNPVVTKLNEAELKSIAENGNGIYQYFTNSDEVVHNIDAKLKTMGQKPITENSLINYNNLFPWFLAATLLLLMIEFFVTEIKRKSRKQTAAGNKNSSAISLGCLLFVLAPFAASSQQVNQLVKKGNEAYTKKQYDVAVDQYKKAIAKNADNTLAQYNLGNALYKGEKIDEAVAAYDAAIEKAKAPIDKSGAYYNKGVALQNSKKLPECIQAYKEALRLNPADEDARLNLQKALLQQQQQQQQQKQKNDQQKQKPKEDQQKKDQQQKQEQDKEKDNAPKPQPSKMSKKEAEEKLKALLQQEKKLQDKLRRVNAASPTKPDKDW